MFCGQCGVENNNNEMYCKNCGRLIQENYMQMENNPAQQEYNGQVQQPMQENVEYSQQPNYNQTHFNNTYQNQNNGQVQPKKSDMQKWADWCVILPSLAILAYITIGINIWLCLVCAGASFTFAERAKPLFPKKVKIGQILSGIVIAIAIIIFVFNILEIFIA